MRQLQKLQLALKEQIADVLMTITTMTMNEEKIFPNF